MIRGMIRPRSSHSLFLKGPTGPWHSKVRFRYDSGYVSGMIRGMIRACNCFLKNRKNRAVSNTFKKYDSGVQLTPTNPLALAAYT